MSSVTLDLPEGVLEAAARLAQERNVPRSEVFAMAIGAWVRVEALEAELAGTRAEAEARAGELESLRVELSDARAAANGLAAELAETRAARDAAGAARRSLEDELAPLRESLSAVRDEAARLAADAAAASRRAGELEELDRKKVLAVMQDEEVAKLRAHGQELAVAAQKLEKDLEYRKIAGTIAARKLDLTARKLSATNRVRRDLERRLRVLQKDTFASERQIGGLLRDRAKLREELRRLARLINRGLAGAQATVARKAAKKPQPTRKENT